MTENGRHKACRACRERKIKCDGEMPKCRRCERHGQDCFYMPTSRRYNKADFAMMLQTINHRILQIEAAATQNVNVVRPPHTSTTPPNSIPSLWSPFTPNMHTTAGGQPFPDADFAFAGVAPGHFPNTEDFPMHDIGHNGTVDMMLDLPGTVVAPDSSDGSGPQDVYNNFGQFSAMGSHADGSQTTNILRPREASLTGVNGATNQHALPAPPGTASTTASSGPRTTPSGSNGRTAESETDDAWSIRAGSDFGMPWQQQQPQQTRSNHNSSVSRSSVSASGSGPSFNGRPGSRSRAASGDESSPPGGGFSSSTSQSQTRYSPCSSSTRRTIGNGASFQDTPKLRGTENYDEWMRAIRAAARKEGVWDMMTGVCERPRTPPPDAPASVLQEHNDDMTYWSNKRELALGGLEGSLSGPIQGVIDDIECAREVWLKLESTFKPSDHKVLYTTLQTLDGLSLASTECGGSVERLAEQMNLLKERLAGLLVNTQAQALPDWYFGVRFLLALGPQYNTFVSSVMGPGSELGDLRGEVTFEQLVASALAEEKRLAA